MSQPEEIRVRDAIVQPPHEINGLASVEDALGIMLKTGDDVLVIEKRTEEDEFGVLTLGMIATQVFGQSRKPARVSVYEVMEKPAINLPANMQARYAIRLLERLKPEVAIVVEDGKLTGAIGLRELAIAEAKGPQQKTLPAPDEDQQKDDA